MEIVILVCGVVNLVLLAVLVMRTFSGDGGRSAAALETRLNDLQNSSDIGFDTLMKQGIHQSGATVKQVSEMGDGLRNSMVQQITDLGRTLSEGQAQNRRELLEQLDRMQKGNQAALETLQRSNQESLARINETVNEKLQKTLNDRISESFRTVSDQLTEVYKGLGEMKSIASGVSDLKNVLSNVKNRGTMGEIQLAAILGDILPPELYEAQCAVKPRSAERVDFAVKLPGHVEGESVWLPIDSKFPGDTWGNLLDAYETGDREQLAVRRKALEVEIKRCAKSIHDKYIAPPHTTDFAILFLPFEGLYAEVVNMGMVEGLQREYKVNVTGPSTMAAMLNSLQMGFRTLAIQKKSGEVWKVLEAAKKEFGNFGDALEKVQTRLRQADSDLDTLIGTRTRAINRKLKTVGELDASEDAAGLLELDVET